MDMRYVVLVPSLVVAWLSVQSAWGDAVISNEKIDIDTLSQANDISYAISAKCVQVQNDAARLACFDSMMSNTLPTYFVQKNPLDLPNTIKSTVEGKLQVVRRDVFSTQNNKTDHKIINKTNHQTHNSADDNNKNMPVPISQAQLGTTGLSRVDFEIPKAMLERYTPLSLSFDLDKNSERGLWVARPHNANYVLPLYLTANPNRHPHTPTHPIHEYTSDQIKKLELKYQISLKTKAMENLFGTDADMWIGYTQKSHWQLYNDKHSHLFRTHDYKPEVFLTQPVVADLPFDGRLRMLGVGFVHHSNGEDDPLSRSWNRLYVMGGAEWGNLTVMPQVWARLFGNIKRRKPNDNPDIVDYYGYGDVRFLYQMDKGRHFSGLVRYNPLTHKGAVQLDYVQPMRRGIGAYVQLFHGYGKSLIDYNQSTTSVGVGVMLNDWMGL